MESLTEPMTLPGMKKKKQPCKDRVSSSASAYLMWSGKRNYKVVITINSVDQGFSRIQGFVTILDTNNPGAGAGLFKGDEC